MQNKKINFLQGISSYLDKLTSQDGSLICPYHRLEHTGKNVYATVINIKLYELTKAKEYLSLAKRTCLRTLETIYKDPDREAWVFYPGMFDRRNLSDNVIDCGACVDVLSSFYLKYKENLSSIEDNRFLEIIHKVSDTYLKEAVIKKPVTNRRLWGATGLSVAYKIFKNKEWKEALKGSIEKSLKEQNADGSFPYHYQYDFSGKNEVAPYYHSRHLAFIYYILENIDSKNQILDSVKGNLVKGADFLLALINPDGIKEMMLESKRFYWNPYYEIASNTFDIYALIKTYELTNNPKYQEYSRISFKQILKHQAKDGGIIGSRYLKQDFKCRIFVNAQMAWLCRVIEKIPKESVCKADQGAKAKWQIFQDSGLCRYRNEEMSVLFRYKKKPFNITYGSMVGGGSIVYFGTKKNKWKNTIKPPNSREGTDGNFIFTLKKFALVKGLKTFMRDNRWVDIRFRLALARIVFETGLYLKGLLYPYKNILIPFIHYLRESYTVQWATEAKIDTKGTLVKFRSLAARPDGLPWQGATVERTYNLQENHVEVIEQAELTKECLSIIYILPGSASEPEIETNLRYHIQKRKIIFKPSEAIASLKIKYTIR